MKKEDQKEPGVVETIEELLRHQKPGGEPVDEDALLERLVDCEATFFSHVPGEDGTGETGCFQRPATKDNLRRILLGEEEEETTEDTEGTKEDAEKDWVG